MSKVFMFLVVSLMLVVMSGCASMFEVDPHKIRDEAQAGTYKSNK